MSAQERDRVLDHLIHGGTLVDGTGAPARRADVGLVGDRIVAIGDDDAPITDEAVTTTDATGLVVCPGFIDPHTHYDAQLFWDPAATPSSEHGVTSVIGGNCGFTLAPLRESDADYTRNMLASVEGMSADALAEGVDWDWESFGGYLDRLEGRIGVNAGFLVGHCALRRYVMGNAAVGEEADDDQLARMITELERSLAAGGLGFSTTRSRTHADGDGDPVASRWAGREEVLALCAAVGRHEGTTLEGMLDGCLDQFSEDDIDLLVSMSTTARRPINWNVLTVDSSVPERVPRQLSAGDAATEAGGRVVALTMPVQVPMNMNLATHCGLFLLPGWREVLTLPIEERKARLADPDTRAWMLERAQSPEAGVFRRLADFANYVIGDTYSEANEGLGGRRVGDIAVERGADPFATLVDIAINDDLRTILWPIPPDGDDASWALRSEVWEDPRALLGGSDAGAHLDRMCGAPYPTRFLGDTLRGRGLTTLERAVEMMTSTPARLFGLRDRGRVAEGARADLVIFDPETVGAEHARLVHDLPAQSPRLTAAANGMVKVLVNGAVTVTDGEATGALAGEVLRSGRDTDTVATP